MNVAINATNFPDEAFRNYVATYLDLGADGYIDDNDIAEITSIRIPYTGNYVRSSEAIHNLKGIEYFTEVTSLAIYNEPIESGLAFGALKKLESCDVQLDSVAATSLDFRGCDSLTAININDNYGTNSYTDIYLNEALKEFTFECYGSAALDFSNCSNLETVTVKGYVTPIIGLNNHTVLENVTISSRSVIDLDLSNNQALVSVDCAMSEHDAPQLLSLNCSHCPMLQIVNCNKCKLLASLNMTGCVNLEILKCNSTAIRPSLDLRELTKLKTLSVCSTNLSSLLLGEKPELTSLQCYTDTDKIYIRRLDLNGCKYLRGAFVRDMGAWCGSATGALKYDSRTEIEPVPVHALDGREFTIDFNLLGFSASDYRSVTRRLVNRTTGESAVIGASDSYTSEATVDLNGSLLYFTLDGIAKVDGYNRHYTSPDFLIFVLEPPVINVQPQSVSVANGYETAFSVVATDPNGGELTYQWEKSTDGEEWAAIQSNANSAVYSVPVSTADDGCSYRCIVSSSVASTTSDAATVSVVLANFQWQVSDDNGSTWTDISQNGDNSSYSFIASKSDSGKQYRCIATNVAGSDISDPATLTVYDPPAIASRSVIPECIAENSEVSLSVTASGDDLHYRWEESANFGAWAPIDGATSSTYSFTALRADTGKRYRCYVYNDVGNVVCDIYDDPTNAENGPTSITVVYKPVVSPEESSSVVRTGNRASFGISAEGGRLTYKWQVSSDSGSTWTDIPNATEDAYGFTSTKSDSGKQYRCQVTNIAGTTYSVVITLTVLDPPVINSVLAGQEVILGEDSSFSSDASGDELQYQWQYSSDNITWNNVKVKGTSSTYSFVPTTKFNRRYYRYRVYNDVGEETSNAALLIVCAIPDIKTQPESQVIAAGQNVTFTLSANGEGLSYKWQQKSSSGSTWSDIPNATTLSYSFTATKSDSGKQYRCQVTNIAGTVESDPASLKVLYEPVIVTNPEFPNRVTAGDYVHCDADAHGDELQHQWYVKYAGIDQWYPIDAESSDVYTDSVTYEHEPHQENGEWIAGARFVRLAFYVTKEFFGNKYYCEFWNDVGRVSTPETNVLYVLSEPTIKSVSAPDSAVRTGNPVSLSVVADGGDLSYQWQISVDNGASWQNVVDGGKASTYSFTATVSQNGYQYQCIVTNVVGSATCAPISLKVQAAPSISAGPVSQSVGLDTTATFTAAISGTDLVYQWQVSSDNGATWIDISDTDAPSYSLTASIEKDGHMYRCRASNDLGFVVTGSALLTVLTFPAIITQPSPATVEYASNVVFLVSATGGELAYQWEYSSDNGVTWTKITKNGTNTTYSFLAVDSQNGYLYHCIVGNKLGTVTSEPASLTVLGSATTEEEIPVLVFAGKYLPSQMAAMIRELPIGANLDEIAFGARAVESLHASIGRTGSTDPRYYEEIAESINELKSLIAQLQSQNPSS